MTSLTATAQFFKKVAPLLTFLAITALLIFLITFRLTRETIKPQPSPLPITPPNIDQNPAQKRPSLIDFSKVQISPTPEELPVFETEKYTLPESVIEKLASSFGITTRPFLIEENSLDGRQYNWQQESIKLSVSQTELRYENRSENQQAEGRLSQEELLSIASSFIQKIPVLPPEVVYNPQKTKYLIFSKNRLSSADNFPNAQVVEFSFDKKLATLPVIGTTPDSLYLKVRITKNGKITYLSSRFFNRFLERGSYQIKTSEQAIEEVESGQGQIVQAVLLDENQQALELFRNQPVDVKFATITKISLAYFLPSQEISMLQPIFVFEGNFQKDNQNGKIIIYLPAIKNSP